MSEGLEQDPGLAARILAWGERARAALETMAVLLGDDTILGGGIEVVAARLTGEWSALRALLQACKRTGLLTTNLIKPFDLGPPAPAGPVADLREAGLVVDANCALDVAYALRQLRNLAFSQWEQITTVRDCVQRATDALERLADWLPLPYRKEEGGGG